MDYKTKLVALVLLLSLAIAIAAVAEAEERYELLFPAVSAYPIPEEAYPEPTWISTPNPAVATIHAHSTRVAEGRETVSAIETMVWETRAAITPSYRP